MRHAIVSCFITALTLLLFSGAGHFAAAQGGSFTGPVVQPGRDLVQLAGGCPSYRRPCREPERRRWRSCRNGGSCGESRRDAERYRCGDDGWRCRTYAPPVCGLLCWMRRTRHGYCGRGCGYYLQRHQYYDDDD